jgi:hypothetical protein
MPPKEELDDFAGIYDRLTKRFATFEEVGDLIDTLAGVIVSAKNDLIKKIDDRLATLKDGVDGKDGKDGKNGKDGARGPQGERGAPGKNGRDGADGLDGMPGRDGNDGKPGKDGKPADESRVTVLEKKVKELDGARVIQRGVFGGGRPVHVPMVDVFTGDGVTTTFYLTKQPRDLRTVKAWGSDFPHIMVHGATNGFEITGKALALNNSVDAPSDQARLVVEYYV